MTETTTTPSETPNVVISDPKTRRIASNTIFIVGALLGTVLTVDGVTDAFDLTDYTVPTVAGFVFLASAFGFSVTLPNIPKR